MSLRRLFALFSCLLALFFTPPAAAQPHPRLAEMLAAPAAASLVGARDTELFAWVETASGVRNVWVGGPGKPARRVTRYQADDGIQIYGLALSPDGRKLAFVRGGDEEWADEEGQPNTGSAPLIPPQEVVLVDLGAGTINVVGEGHSPVFSPDGRALAFTRRGQLWLAASGEPARRIAHLRGSVRRPSWSPDGTALLFSEVREDNSYIALVDADGTRLRYLDAGLGQSVEPVFSPDGKAVAFIRYLDPPAGAGERGGPYWSLRQVDIVTGVARELWRPTAGQGGRYAGTRSRNLFWSRSGVLLFPWEESGWLHVYALDPARPAAPRALTRGAFEVESFALDERANVLIHADNSADIDGRTIRRTPLAGGRTQPVARAGGMQFAPVVAGTALAAIATDTAQPAHPVMLAEGRWQPLRQPASLGSFDAPQSVRFPSTDGQTVYGQLFRAAGPGPHPAVIFIHGGPRRQMLAGMHPSSYYARTYLLNQYLAARGFTVLAVNYRGGTGYGQAFRDAAETGREGASEYRDILAAGRWLAARPEVDGARIGLWGGSWGGYLTALSLARDSDLFAAGVDLHGVHTLLRAPSTKRSPAQQQDDRQLQWDSSPVAAIDGWRSPVLLIHGDDDFNVDFAQSVLLARELAARGIPYEELVFPNERHSFFRHDSWVRALTATAGFLERKLGAPR